METASWGNLKPPWNGSRCSHKWGCSLDIFAVNHLSTQQLDWGYCPPIGHQNGQCHFFGRRTISRTVAALEAKILCCLVNRAHRAFMSSVPARNRGITARVVCSCHLVSGISLIKASLEGTEVGDFFPSAPSSCFRSFEVNSLRWCSGVFVVPFHV